MKRIIDVAGLKKSYGDVQAVRGIDFYAGEGTLFAFLGPNGAGKSTTISMLCTFLRPDGGRAEIDGNLLGQDDAKIRDSIGVVFQEGVLDGLLTVRENLNMRGGLYGLSGAALAQAAERAAQAAGAAEFLDRRYGTLSGGQRRRADIARALVHTPKVLFLDEPTTGLDPQTRGAIWDTVRSIQRESGTTVFLTTHYMQEAETADYITVIDHGEVAARGTPAELKERYSSDRLVLGCSDFAPLTEFLERQGIPFSRTNGTMTVPLRRTTDAIPLLEQFGGTIVNFEVRNGTMDDVFISITGKETRDE